MCEEELIGKMQWCVAVRNSVCVREKECVEELIGKMEGCDYMMMTVLGAR